MDNLIPLKELRLKLTKYTKQVEKDGRSFVYFVNFNLNSFKGIKLSI
jgi:hypothetical protein